MYCQSKHYNLVKLQKACLNSNSHHFNAIHNDISVTAMQCCTVCIWTYYRQCNAVLSVYGHTIGNAMLYCLYMDILSAMQCCTVCIWTYYRQCNAVLSVYGHTIGNAMLYCLFMDILSIAMDIRQMLYNILCPAL